MYVLETLAASHIVPTAIVTTPDAPQGRGLHILPNDVKKYAISRGIPCITPETLKTPEAEAAISELGGNVFLVASYGNIIPKNIINLPRLNTLNIHPSLLPTYRGPSPIQSMILQGETNIGVSIMLIDEYVDHGPVVAQTTVTPTTWPLKEVDAEVVFAKAGTDLFIDILPQWISGTASPKEQDHQAATFTRKFVKQDGQLAFSIEGIDIEPEQSITLYRQFCAFHRSPGAFFFDSHNGREIRIKVTEATLKDGLFTPLRIIPEGKREMDYESYLRGRQH